MNDIQHEDGITIEHFEKSATHTTNIEGDKIDSVEDYIAEDKQMERNRQSSPFIENDADEDAQTVEEDEEVEDYVSHNYVRDSNNTKNDKQVFQEKMKNILQEMKVKEIIRDKNSGPNPKQSHPYTMNNRPLTAESMHQAYDQSGSDGYVKDEEEIVEEIQVEEVSDEVKTTMMRMDDRESSVQYEFEPEPENDTSVEPQPQLENDELQYEEQSSKNIIYRSEDSDTQSRFVYNQVPAMNSKTNDAVSFVQERVQTLKLDEEPQITVNYTEKYNHRPLPAFYNKTIANNIDKTAVNPSTSPALTVTQISSQNSSTSRSRPIRPIYQSSVTLSNQNHTTPNYSSNSVMHYPVRRAYSPREEPMSPTRNALHIGSQVISEQSGPSFTIFLRRPSSERHWGFSFHGGAEYGCPPFVNKVTSNGLANHAGLEVGDVIVSICNSLTVGKTYEQVKAEILRAGNELDLILIRRGVDLDKVAQVAPHIMTTSSFGHQSSFDSDSNSQKKLSTRSLTRGRLFRPIQTKSLRILEQQLSISESTGNPVVKPRQNAHEPRIITSPSYSSSFNKPYGQNVNSQGYTTDIQIKPQQIHHVTTPTTILHPTSNQIINPVQYNSYDYGRTMSNISPNQWVTTQPIRISNTMNTNNMNNINNRQSYQRTNNVNWVKAVPSNQYSQNDMYSQSTYTMNSYTEQRDSSSTRSIPIYPTSYSPYRYQQ
ncbi:PDZ and LIM domain protein 7 [Schistosoma japonicum]|nr:PDZ and LIM domain protein 7 [Schistosoma japonicum]